MLYNIKKHLRPIYVPLVNKWQYFLLHHRQKLKIMSSIETIQYIKRNNCSIARLGDGEFKLMIHGGNIGFQPGSLVLKEKLIAACSGKNKNLLVCIPKCLVSVRGMIKFSSVYWSTWCLADNHYKEIASLMNQTVGEHYKFGDAMVTRPYIDWKHRSRAKRVFMALKSIWEDRDILIVEGDQTRLGIGNDLFDNAKSIKRILAPAIDAFKVYDEIVQTVKDNYSGELVLAALGPTATVLAADLSNYGIQTIDIGHIDIEYMWFLMKAKTKVAIPGKYTNEVHEGHTFTECDDSVYLDQVIKKIVI